MKTQPHVTLNKIYDIYNLFGDFGYYFINDVGKMQFFYSDRYIKKIDEHRDKILNEIIYGD